MTSRADRAAWAVDGRGEPHVPNSRPAAPYTGRSLHPLARAMKTLLVLALALAALPTAAQQTLLGDGRFTGGFGGPVVKFSSINGRYATLVGGRGGALFTTGSGHAFSIGGGGYGIADEHGGLRWGRDDQNRPLYLQMGYGGFELEYVNRADDLVHVSVQTLIGGGGIQMVDIDGNLASFFDRVLNDGFDVQDAFFVFEPGANVMLNVTEWFRIGGGVSYRLVRGAALADVSNSDLSAVAGTLTFKFGSF